MSRFRRFEIVEHSPAYLFEKTSIFSPPTRTLSRNPHFPSFPIVEDELYLPIPPISFVDVFNTITDLIQIHETPFHTSTHRVTRRAALGAEMYLQELSDRVAALELGFDGMVKGEKTKKRIGASKYRWTAEIKSPKKDRKYKWMTEIKDDGKKGLEKSYKWTAEIKGKEGEYSPVELTYTINVSGGDKAEEEKKKCEKSNVKAKSVKPAGRVVEIEEPTDHGAIVLRQVFAKRVEKSRGKRKQLSPQDAAALIQMSFRAYLIRRSQALRALRELAIAKNKLKELRGLFNNFSYRRHISHDAEERQRFSEKVIVLLLTVDAIEGADLMGRGAKKSMVDELEAMLDVVDPQTSGKSLSMRRRTFDMPDAEITKELAAGVAQVV